VGPSGRIHYYYQKINRFEKAGYFELLLDNSSEIVRLEAKIDIIQNRVHRIVKKSARSLTMEQETYLEESANFIHDIRLNHSSYRINTTGVLTLILLYNTLKETQKVIQLFEMVIQDAKESPNKYPSRHLNIFYGQAVEQFIKIGEYEKANKLFKSGHIFEK
jgi:predicted PurR-regulated permease PerM